MMNRAIEPDARPRSLIIVKDSGIGAQGWMEGMFFLGGAFLFLLAAAGVWLRRNHFAVQNERVQYALHHLAGALFVVSLFTAFVGVLRLLLPKVKNLAARPTSFYLFALAVLVAIFWLPVVLAGGFVQDDWMLLSAAAIRKIIYLHPAYSWYALDSVDGNFRPLGTVLYYGFMLRQFGLSPVAFLMGNFVVTLLSTFIAFAIVRELGYSKIAAAAASILYLSRGMIYTENAWASALGDGLSILFCGLTAFAVLRAAKRTGPPAFAWHLAGWSCFAIATLAKQSAFAAPAIVALLLWMRPGVMPAVSLTRRLRETGLALLVYGATAAFVFEHARNLLRGKTPYPLSFGFVSLQGSFMYVARYFMTIELPAQYPLARTLPVALSLIFVVALTLLIRKYPRMLGERPRDLFFLAFAALVSLALLWPLGERMAAYYGSMFAFWFSLALGVVLSRLGELRSENRASRVACFIVCLLVTLGFLDVRLKQTALIPSGGYIWGTFGMDRERAQFQQISAILASHLSTETLVLVDCPAYPGYFTAMARLASPRLSHVLVYDSETGHFLANDLEGASPRDEFDALGNAAAYNVKIPLTAEAAAKMMSGSNPLWIRFVNGRVEVQSRDYPLHQGSRNANVPLSF